MRGQGNLITQLEDEIKDLFGLTDRSEFQYGLMTGIGGDEQELSSFESQREIWSLEDGDCLLVRRCKPKRSEGEEKGEGICAPPPFCMPQSWTWGLGN